MRIVYDSFAGRCSDTPRTVWEALLDRERRSPDGDRHEHVWLADPAQAATFPAGTQTVPKGTDDEVRVLESADLVVGNTHIEAEWDKRPGATYVQTWHGTPLKRIHHDVLWAPEGVLDRLSRDVDRWDLLLSPNPYSTRMMRGAFRYEGEVLETGYPRNDALVSPGAQGVRDAVRAELGIRPDQTAVLYTPTWRDQAFYDGSDPAALGVDLDRLADELGDSHVLLVRTHYKLTGLLRPQRSARVRDVSARPEVSDLYLAADAMVTDYSSTMFDFAVTGKPLVLYAYDLASYRDELRGFYFDLEADPPGPVLGTREELGDRLAHLDEVAADHAEAYGRFRQRFCPLDDGHATERFLERVLPA